MKNLKVLFGALTIVLAIGSAFATKSSVDINAYRKLTADGTPVLTDCKLLSTCANSGTIRCTAVDPSDNVTYDLFKVVNSACDVAIFRPN